MKKIIIALVMATVVSASPVYAKESANSAVVQQEENGFRYLESIPLNQEVQEYLYKVCQEHGIDYAFALATIQLESDFTPDAVHYNKNGSVDRGLCQLNSCTVSHFKEKGLINSSDDLFNVYKNIDCGMDILGDCVAKHGNTEKAYACYNTGSDKVNTNRASRLVWGYKQDFDRLLNS